MGSTSHTERPAKTRRWWRRKRRLLPAVVIVSAVVVAVLFSINGLVLAANESPISNVTEDDLAIEVGDRTELKIMTYNIAKGFIHRGGISFEDSETVRRRTQQIGKLIADQQPDLVFLSEVIFECGPSPVNQVRILSEVSGLTFWVFGENYNFGLPFFRVVGGNAILSRFPIEPVGNPSLAGRQPFYITKNNRRALWCRMQLRHQEVLLAAVHNDSFNLENNLRQTEQLLSFANGRATIMAGDFNAQPHEAPIRRLLQDGGFAGTVDGPSTYPARHPEQAIDFVLAPPHWSLKDHHVVASTLSDHLPVVSTFSLPSRD